MFGFQVRIIARVLIVAVIGVVFTGCASLEKRLAPSHFRDWTPEQAVLPTVETHGDQVTVHHVRNSKYFANDVYLVDYYDKSFDLSRVRGVDYIVVPFDGAPALAHVMLSFQLEGPTGAPEHLAVSVETRKERNEKYNPIEGSLHQYELIYVVADERDVIQFRTVYNGEQVYLYHTTATPEASRELLVDVLNRVNELAARPEFYDTLTNNCTSNIVQHVNRIKPNRIVTDYRSLLPGLSDQLAYDEGLIERHGTFEQTKELAYVNPYAQRYAGRDDFSELIRRR
ncbi:MAG: DUF4105 domain-containing protein [Pirellulales bacterium]